MVKRLSMSEGVTFVSPSINIGNEYTSTRVMDKLMDRFITVEMDVLTDSEERMDCYNICSLM